MGQQDAQKVYGSHPPAAASEDAKASLFSGNAAPQADKTAFYFSSGVRLGSGAMRERHVGKARLGKEAVSAASGRVGEVAAESGG